MNLDLKNIKIAFIGAGHLAGTIISALIDKLNIDGQNIAIHDNVKEHKRVRKSG